MTSTGPCKRRGSKAERKPRGRQAATANPVIAASPELKDSSRVQVTGANGKQYIVSVKEMWQRSALTGNRRAVQRDSLGTWYYDNAWSSTSSSSGRGHNWVLFPRATQRTLETAYKWIPDGRGASRTPHDDVQSAGRCKCGADMVPASSSEPWFCDGCRRHVHGSHIPIVLRLECSQTPDGCNFDLCGCCNSHSALQQSQRVQEFTSKEELASMVETVAAGNLTVQQMRLACDAAFAPTGDVTISLRILRTLALRHEMAFTSDDARQAAMRLGSMAALQIAFQSNPDLQMQGFAIFDRRYPGLRINDDGLKRCIKALAARGACLGHSGLSFIPSSKLLRKIQADAFPSWVERYFVSMRAAGVDLPDLVQNTIEEFLF